MNEALDVIDENARRSQEWWKAHPNGR